MKQNSSKFGFYSIVLLGINSIIGTGIFLLPGKAYHAMGTASIFCYLLITVLAGIMAFCFAEAAGLFQVNGGAYIYTKEAFGNFAGFEVGVMKYVVQIIAWATMAVGFVTALSAVFPAVASGPLNAVMIIAVIISLSIINLIGVNVIKYVNNLATIGKIIPLILFVAIGVFCLKGSNFQPVFPAGLTGKGFSETCILVFYAFTGFEAISTAAEDMQDAKKNLPRAIAAAICCVAVIYIMVQVVCIGTMGSTLANSSTPVVDSMSTFLGSAGSLLVTAGTLISIGGINAAASFLTPRGCLALSEQGMLPPVILKKTSRGTPYAAILLSALLTIPVALSGSFTQLAVISTISRFSQYIPTCLSILVFRRRKMKSTFQIPFGPVLPIAATGISIWLLANTAPEKIIKGLGALLIIAPLYVVMKLYNQKHGYAFQQSEAGKKKA